ncbi:MAG TPA: FAD-binding oxidoreductase [Bacilli bacterium]|nr:MAG: 4-methylaminobutanoate oxidase (formaldehyde-forming) [Tenericutes bacterium ADurb.BinA124]HNZ50769.1 FAD-binding oxidoreductase [Bacilli bacterium]HPN61015.1 FAD-binding oxidoreductase [Bacilli bacterium]HPX84137.1 FAD-binding oxidoreductase [Bacilli bacterium]HQC74428.1 FAD-binding oxidoreductase [Bacilli bacterium]
MRANYVIIGAGISGTSIAYHLAKAGETNIVVVDKAYLSNGATGRCGAGVRQQWATKMNCLLAKASVEFFENAQNILNYPDDLEFQQEGYLIVAVNDEEDQHFSKSVDLQNALGIPSRKITKAEAKQIVPHLNTDAIVSATFCPSDGHLNPFKMNDAFYRAAKALGVQFYFFEEVKEIVVINQRIEKVITNKQTIETHNVINAAGGFAHEVGQLAGLDIPVYAEKHEILATEPIEKIQGPMVMSFGKNLYCQQVPHGNFIMGRSTPGIKPSHSIASSWSFLEEMSKTIMEILPLVGNLRVVRQWAGSYNMSPDRQPIIDEAKELPGFYMACGFSGHGFMFSPMTGQLLTEIILKKPLSIDISELSLERFKNATVVAYEKLVV